MLTFLSSCCIYRSVSQLWPIKKSFHLTFALFSRCKASAKCFVQSEHQPSHQRNQDITGLRCRTRTISLRLAVCLEHAESPAARNNDASSRNDSAGGDMQRAGARHNQISASFRSKSVCRGRGSLGLFPTVFLISVSVSCRTQSQSLSHVIISSNLGRAVLNAHAPPPPPPPPPPLPPPPPS